MAIEEKNLRAFLDKICIDFGICVLGVEKERLVERCLEDPAAMLELIFEFEGLDPVVHSSLFRDVKKAWGKYSGS